MIITCCFDEVSYNGIYVSLYTRNDFQVSQKKPKEVGNAHHRTYFES